MRANGRSPVDRLDDSQTMFSMHSSPIRAIQALAKLSGADLGVELDMPGDGDDLAIDDLTGEDNMDTE